MSNFLNNSEEEIYNEFLQNGYIIRKSSNIPILNDLQNYIVESSAKILGIKEILDNQDWLNNIHKFVKPENLNDFRLKVIHSITSNDYFRKNYYNVSRNYLDMIVGNELAMQLRINLSIQLPMDNSSLLPVHADTWSGDSPFEAVVWIPLVDCYKTKTMFILPPNKTEDLHENFELKSGKNSKDLYENIKNDIIWLELKYGEILIFNQSLPHGNIVNQESETRWSMNCRFKGIFTPYKDKKLGEFFEPITLKPLSKLGMNYNFPKIKS
ncbi:2OG-Fe(II) oxygenase [Pseudomonadota bacterium]|nr:2OG-Fe(II) oxygenase [Pseudomonadota bacterium]